MECNATYTDVCERPKLISDARDGCRNDAFIEESTQNTKCNRQPNDEYLPSRKALIFLDVRLPRTGFIGLSAAVEHIALLLLGVHINTGCLKSRRLFRNHGENLKSSTRQKIEEYSSITDATGTPGCPTVVFTFPERRVLKCLGSISRIARRNLSRSLAPLHRLTAMRGFKPRHGSHHTAPNPHPEGQNEPHG